LKYEAQGLQPLGLFFKTTVSMLANDHKPRSTLGLGLLAVCFFGVHAAGQIWAGTPENLLWACHVADLCVGLGLIIRWPTLTAGGLLMLSIGIPLWLINLGFGGTFYPTSVLTHLGGFVVGVFGLRRLAPARYDWLTAVSTVAGLLIASRALTNPVDNINLAFSFWRAVGPLLDAPELHVLAVLSFWVVALWPTQYGLRMLRLIPRHPHTPVVQKLN
jgi:hypothetical protein